MLTRHKKEQPGHLKWQNQFCKKLINLPRIERRGTHDKSVKKFRKEENKIKKIVLKIVKYFEKKIK